MGAQHSGEKTSPKLNCGQDYSAVWKRSEIGLNIGHWNIFSVPFRPEKVWIWSEKVWILVWKSLNPVRAVRVGGIPGTTNWWAHHFGPHFVFHPFCVPFCFAPNFLQIAPFLLIFNSLESPVRELSNESKISKNGTFWRQIWAKQKEVPDLLLKKCLKMLKRLL